MVGNLRLVSCHFQTKSFSFGIFFVFLVYLVSIGYKNEKYRELNLTNVVSTRIYVWL